MSNETDIFVSGADLVNYAANTEEHSKYGTVSGLFPYIYEASKKMGIRAISRWLKEERGITVSPATISRALRNPESHWEIYSDEVILPHALKIFEAYNLAFEGILFSDDGSILNAATQEMPTISVDNAYDAADEIGELKNSVSFLLDNWYCLSKPTRLNCYKYFREQLKPTKRKRHES